MRLSEWRAHAPVKDAVTPKVTAIVASALVTLGAEADPECWVVWGDDPAIRHLLFVPTAAGLLQVGVRVAVPGEGPRTAAKVIRWNRVQLGELAVEIQGGHRLVTFQAEGQVLSGVDETADAIAAFAQALFAAVDGRTGSFADAARPAKTPVKRARRASTAVATAGAPSGRPSKPSTPRKGS
ncbi:MAG TPA: hypothetical protein VF119_04935 [Candidatus Limnocylindrales bacterium]